MGNVSTRVGVKESDRLKIVQKAQARAKAKAENIGNDQLPTVRDAQRRAPAAARTSDVRPTLSADERKRKSRDQSDKTPPTQGKKVA